jgi:phage gp29-like protein
VSRAPTLVDRWGNPLRRLELTADVAGPTITGVRTPLTGYPADGLDPVRLAAILRAADMGDPVRYLELAETIEERDLHYLGVLGTRRRSVSQIEITVEPASDAAEDEAKAQMVRDWLKRDELGEELFDILDCIGKGYSFTEIIWDVSEGQWSPGRLEWRDPRWFRFLRHDLATPVMLGEHGAEVPLPAFKFIFATMKAKSGIALRSGLARAAAWAWMFKAFTQRDWAIFTQTYGQPLRVGKFGAGATEQDKATLFRAVANIAGDCAAIIPESMMIEFVENKSIGATSDLYLKRADWLDQQVSKAVLGQTATTDAVTGGLGSGKEHREVQEDIERADARQLSAIINRDLIRPWMQLEFGPLPAYPRIVIARPEKEDVGKMVDAVARLVPLGLKVSQGELRGRLGLKAPEAGEEVLSAPVRPETGPEDGDDQDAIDPKTGNRAVKRDSGEIKRGGGRPGPEAALNAAGAPAATKPGGDPVDSLAERLQAEADAPMGDMMAAIEAMLDTAGSLPEFGEMLQAAFPKVDAARLAEAIAMGLVAAETGGRAAVEEGSA